ncbi:cytidylyltransferase domain-containing protein [Azospirillum largimobile]
MDRVGAIILARMDSRRLPGKALARIGNRSLLWHVACRLPRPLFDAPPVLATTNRAVDDPLAAEAAALGLTVFRGAAEDVAGRLLAAADAQRLDGILRVNGDSPFLDAGLIHRAMGIFRQGRAACVTNLRPRRHPYGVSVELFRPAALRVCLARSLNPTDREHVTTCLYAHLDATDLHALDGADQNLGRDDWRVRLTVDEPADLDALRCFALSCSVPWDRVTYRQAVASGLFRLLPDDWPVSGLPGAAPSPALPQTLRTPAQPDGKVQ